MCRGHALIEDVPGVGKTMLARSLAISTGCNFKRMQFTPDLLPSDVIGVSFYNQAKGTFEFRPGPIMAQVVMADEINRATPKTQSALLEAMEERQVSVDGVTHTLPRPFFVIATQNHVEYEGTFPLPEAQLDRFLQRINMGYPEFSEEMAIIAGQATVHPIERLKPVATPEEVLFLQDAVGTIYIDETVREYVVSIVRATRENTDIALGASPRASLGLSHAAQALALLRGREFVIPDDVKELAEGTIAHRLILSPAARMKGVETSQVVAQILSEVQVPGARRGATLKAV
ncbi:MAG: MoxR family ATPase [Chloroflexi bacterium]|nr:MoxR family ATPase [Chloroflexota bacterium]